MAPTGEAQGLSAKRARFAGPSGLKGIIHNGKTSAIALFAALGGFVYGCGSSASDAQRHTLANSVFSDNQGMFGQVLTMNAFINRVSLHELRRPELY